MFTGIVENLATIRGVRVEGPGRTLLVATGWSAGDVAPGDSVAINGVCLTAADCDAATQSFQAGPETLARTNLGELRAGDSVNVERAMRASGRFGGHFVQGHVDGVATVAERRREQDWEFVEFVADPRLTEQMVEKGSVAVDGVSLTLVRVVPGRFSVMLIPTTLAQTTLGLRQIGATVNVETDILAKYVRQAVRAMMQPS